MTIQKAWTIGSIAVELGEPVHRIQYILRARGIKPSGLAGNCRIFSDWDVARVAAEIGKINKAKGKDRASCVGDPLAR